MAPMTDITTALETLREALGRAWAVLGSHPDPESVYNETARVIGPALAALSTIEAELTRLREENESLDADVLLRDEHIKDLRRDKDTALAAAYDSAERRDEAVAALARIRDLGFKPGAHIENAVAIARDALARLSTPKEPTRSRWPIRATKRAPEEGSDG